MEKQRKFYLVLPLLVIPFLTMAFWALGGGKGTAPVSTAKGLDTELPEAKFREQERSDKMAVYQAADRDSSRDGISPAFLRSLGMAKDSGTVKPAPSADDRALAIQQKLAALQQRMAQPPTEQQAEDHPAEEPAKLRRMDKLMQRSGTTRPAEDPELRQLDRMLDKIQAIQHPDAAVATQEKKRTEKAEPFRAIPAMIDGKQKVADAAAVKFRLTDTVTIKGQLFGAGQPLFGTCQVTNQRLLIQIRNIRVGEQIIPVNLTVFSQDGMPGIPAPEAELGGAASSGADQAIQGMQIMTMDQSFGAQAAAGGINAAKGLFSKKMKKIRVKLRNEYPVLLKINK